MPSGSALVSVLPPLVSCVLSVHWVPPSGLCSLSHDGVPCFWVGGPPPPSPPRQPLALSACNRLGGTLSSVSPPLGSCAGRALGFFVPLLCPNLSRSVLRGPMAVLSYGVPCAGLTSLRRLRRHFVVLAARLLAVFSRSPVCTIKMLWRAPHSAVSHRRLHLLAQRCRPAASRCAVSTVGSFPPCCLGGGWVFVPAPLPPSVLPLSVSGRCEDSRGYVSPGSLYLSGG